MSSSIVAANKLYNSNAFRSVNTYQYGAQPGCEAFPGLCEMQIQEAEFRSKQAKEDHKVMMWLLIIIFVIVILVGIGVGIYYLITPPKKSTPTVS